ncbi:coiled-coil domain-containing protein 134 isoform X5 [Pseudorca crassidens]|uniref:coiled-coil domain-containing protein 134 isoform X5 n=1 Tax=Pseudorca crassidens TaxID=82174 RepID=UPI00352E3495
MQLNIPRAAAKTRCSQINIKKKKKTTQLTKQFRGGRWGGRPACRGQGLIADASDTHRRLTISSNHTSTRQVRKPPRRVGGTELPRTSGRASAGAYWAGPEVRSRSGSRGPRSLGGGGAWQFLRGFCGTLRFCASAGRLRTLEASSRVLDMDLLRFLAFLSVLLLSGTGVTDTLRTSLDPSLEIYKKMFEVKRREQLLALKNLAQLNDVHQQYKILDVMLKGLFKVLEDSRTVLIAADVLPDGPFPQDEKLKDVQHQH